MSNLVVVLIAGNVTAAFGGRFDIDTWVAAAALAFIADIVALVVGRRNIH